ncbi:unnamed protein product [Calypogeia fissa]
MGGDAADYFDVDDQAGVEGTQVGNRAFRAGEYHRAIEAFSEALQAQPADSAILLSNRCASFCRLSQQLREIPASTSEENALFGLDPMSLVQVALKDAEKLLKLRPDWPKAFLRKGTALLLLEQYEQAKDTFLDGLQLDPASKALQAALRDLSAEFGEQLEEIKQAKSVKRAAVLRSEDLDCTICLKLLYYPITTPCGHSFCRACLLQAMDHGNKCPTCRTVLFVSPKSYPVSVTLNNLIQRNFPDEHKERKAEMDEVTLGGNEFLPLFVMNVFLPYEKMQLNIFEPRYRLMVRRIMEGHHRMGMVGIDSQTGALADVGCEVEICECQPLADGRFYLEVEGRRRFNISRAWEQDGYRVAQVQWLKDVAPPEGSSKYEQTMSLVSEASKLFESWISQARNVARTGADRRAKFSELMSRAEGMPDAADAEAFSFWFANLLNMRSAERLHLLRSTDTRERLVQEMELLRGGPQGCNIQ